MTSKLSAPPPPHVCIFRYAPFPSGTQTFWLQHALPVMNTATEIHRPCLLCDQRFTPKGVTPTRLRLLPRTWKNTLTFQGGLRRLQFWRQLPQPPQPPQPTLHYDIVLGHPIPLPSLLSTFPAPVPSHTYGGLQISSRCKNTSTFVSPIGVGGRYPVQHLLLKTDRSVSAFLRVRATL